VLHRLRWKCNCSCDLSTLRNKSSKFYKISPVVHKIMLKLLWLCFFVDPVYMKYAIYRMGQIKLGQVTFLLVTSERIYRMKWFLAGINYMEQQVTWCQWKHSTPEGATCIHRSPENTTRVILVKTRAIPPPSKNITIHHRCWQINTNKGRRFLPCCFFHKIVLV